MQKFFSFQIPLGFVFLFPKVLEQNILQFACQRPGWSNLRLPTNSAPLTVVVDLQPSKSEVFQLDLRGAAAVVHGGSADTAKINSFSQTISDVIEHNSIASHYF